MPEVRSEGAARAAATTQNQVEGPALPRDDTAVAEEEPKWEELDALISRNGLSDDGTATMQWALAQLRTLVGESWLGRQYRKQRRLPAELLYAGTHRYALPQALSLVLRLDRAFSEPTFAKVRSEFRRGADSSAWRHILLQLEVARAAADQGDAVTFEPSIPGSNSKGDLLIAPNTPEAWMVETTTLPRADVDLNWQTYEDQFEAVIRSIERRHDVTCTTVLNDHMAADETQAWLVAVDAAAGSADQTSDPTVVRSEIGTVTIHRDRVPSGTTLFSGAVQYRDGWHRLGRALATKARQIAGPWPAWIRIDCLDGLFQFTEWASAQPQKRIEAIATAIRSNVVWPANAEGIALSSGPAVSLNALDPAAETVTAHTTHGAFLRRLLSPHLVRETFVIPVNDQNQSRTLWWINAYANEPDWLNQDLAAAGKPPLEQLWAASPPPRNAPT